tara:strand:- start:224 stop:691 length:468 start_codon:yes stop_codon:yes gene_type:complete
MAQLGEAIKRSELPVDEVGSYDPLPEGWYTTKITNSELKDTKSGTGQYIKLEFTVTSESFSGRKVWGMLNIRNDNEKAEEIGRKQLNSLMAALGMESLGDTDELVGGDVSIKLKIKEASGGYDASNDVKAYKAIQGGSSPKATAAPEKAAPPWSK